MKTKTLFGLAPIAAVTVFVPTSQAGWSLNILLPIPLPPPPVTFRSAQAPCPPPVVYYPAPAPCEPPVAVYGRVPVCAPPVVVYQSQPFYGSYGFVPPGYARKH